MPTRSPHRLSRAETEAKQTAKATARLIDRAKRAMREAEAAVHDQTLLAEAGWVAEKRLKDLQQAWRAGWPKDKLDALAAAGHI